MTQQNNWQNDMWQGGQASPQQNPSPQPQPVQAQPQAQQAQVQPQGVGPAPQVPPAPEPKKKRGPLIAAIVAVVVLVLVGGMASCASTIVDSIDSLAEWGYTEDVQTQGDTIAIIEMTGTIQYDGSTCSPEGLKEQLDIAEANPDIKAVVLRVDSGGGTATAGEEMSIYVKEFEKPIVVSSASINASAAYEISSQTDYIFTAKSTAIGSIGTAMQIMDMSGLYEKLGISVENITSADSKDSSYGTRGLSDEEREEYQRQITQINAIFIENVAEGRGMTVEEVRALATGMTFTGVDAVENGLADEIGTLEDAIAKACELAQVDYESCGIIYLQPDYYSDLTSLFSLMSDPDISSELTLEDALIMLKELQ